MKKLVTATVLLATLLPGICWADAGELSSGAATASANGPSFVNITNQDTAAAFLTMFLDGKSAYGAPYQQVTTGEWHVDFYPPATFIEMQITCFPGDKNVRIDKSFYNGQRLVIPPGTCSAAATQ